MSYYAKVLDGIVTKVLRAEIEFINNFQDGTPGEWIQTSYNTREGVHELGGTPLRKNFAGIGFTYDTGRDAFIPPKPHPDFILREDTCTWYAVDPSLYYGDTMVTRVQTT